MRRTPSMLKIVALALCAGLFLMTGLLWARGRSRGETIGVCVGGTWLGLQSGRERLLIGAGGWDRTGTVVWESADPRAVEAGFDGLMMRPGATGIQPTGKGVVLVSRYGELLLVFGAILAAAGFRAVKKRRAAPARGFEPAAAAPVGAKSRTPDSKSPAS